MIKKFYRLTGVVAVAIALGAGVFSSGFAGELSASERIDTLSRAMDRLESKVLTTLMSGASSPISFGGDMALRMQFHNFTVYPDWIEQDRSYLTTNWKKGDDYLVRLEMVARPSRNTTLWTSLGLNNTMVGAAYEENGPDGFRNIFGTTKEGIALVEGLLAGAAVRTIPASFWVRMGTILWTEGSPFTIWTAPTRQNAWDYLSYEDERPVAAYYESALAMGYGEGRGAWHKKAMSGLNLESINLPWNLYFNLAYGTFESIAKIEIPLDLAGDLGYEGDDLKDISSTGIGDSYRRMLHGRIALERTLANLTLGANYSGINVNDDIIHASEQWKTSATSNLFRDLFNIGRRNSDRGYFLENDVLSLDLRGPISDKMDIHTDIAVSMVDTNWMVFDTSASLVPFTKKEISTSSPGVALFGKVNLKPFQIEAIYADKAFYSPLSFITPLDAFAPIGTNRADPGHFAVDAYPSNTAGLTLLYEPKLSGFGHFRVRYGSHVQPKAGKDMLFFPYRLNGKDFGSVSQTSYTRYGKHTIDHSIPGRQYNKRLGDESLYSIVWEGSVPREVPYGPYAGGIRGGYYSGYEGFVAYRSREEALANLQSGLGHIDFKSEHTQEINIDGRDTTLTSPSRFIPESQKFSFNLETEFGYDISKFVGYKRDLLIGGFAAVSGVSRSFKPIAFSDQAEDMLLWSLYLRLDPAIQLADNFYLLGLAGYENWRSQKAWMVTEGGINRTATDVANVPINFTDVALGLGFDWDMLERVRLHGRLKWMKHHDAEFTDNNWQTPVVYTEIKAFF